MYRRASMRLVLNKEMKIMGTNTALVSVFCCLLIGSFMITSSRADDTSIPQHKKRLKLSRLNRSPLETKSEGLIVPDDSDGHFDPQQLTNKERQQLNKIYGSKMVSQHLNDIRIAREIGKSGADGNEHEIPWKGETDAVPGIDMQIIDDARLNAVNLQESSEIDTNSQSAETSNRKSLDPTVVKNLLQDLLQRLDGLEENSIVSLDNAQRIVSIKNGHCNIHGLWLSTVAGAAIELLPVERDNHIEIGTTIFDLPDNPQPGMITSQWTGKGLISSESPTTITIVFQEHLQDQHTAEDKSEDSEPENSINLPKTAVFVGQCLVCENSPVLQGTWVVFPNTQSCLINDNSSFKKTTSETRTPDTIYLLKR